MPSARAFTLTELLACLAAAAVLIALSVPAFSQTSRDGGLAVSLNNVRVIMEAQAAYRADHNRVPMRGSRYFNGQMGGWCGWHFGGKNCHSSQTAGSFWVGYAGGLFDESAYSRPLNSYLYPDVGIPPPSGYVNTGSGSTWTLNPGNPTIQQRWALQLLTFRSPGDPATRQRNWPAPNPSLSGYDDVGTSYLVNMAWWDMPSLSGLPFTQRFDTGVNLIHSQAPDHFIWISDQIGNALPHLLPSTQLPGEFGGINMSVVGFMDGRSEYIELLPNTYQGPRYTFWPGTRALEIRR